MSAIELHDAVDDGVSPAVEDDVSPAVKDEVSPAVKDEVSLADEDKDASSDSSSQDVKNPASKSSPVKPVNMYLPTSTKEDEFIVYPLATNPSQPANDMEVSSIVVVDTMDDDVTEITDLTELPGTSETPTVRWLS